MIVKKERPDVVITTGSMPMALLCFVSKCFGSKVIWIDSIASIRHLSMSGRMVYLVADLILSQWPEVAARYSKVEYVGELI